MERFSESAAKLAGLAGALLGWRSEEFWRATPAELAAVLAAMLRPEAAGASRADLERMLEKFPDEAQNNRGSGEPDGTIVDGRC